MTHVVHVPSTARRRRASPARGALRRWVARHLVAPDPAPAPGVLDVLDRSHRTGGAVQCSPTGPGPDTV